MARTAGLAQAWLLHAMRCPDLVSDAVPWALMEARLMAGTRATHTTHGAGLLGGL